MLPPGIREYYVNYGKLSFAVDGEHTDTELTRLEMDAIAPVMQNTGSAIHLCCGAGRHVSAFALRGVRSAGLDISHFLVRFGWRRILEQGLQDRCRLLQGDVLAPPFSDASAQVVTLLGNCFSLFDSRNIRKIISEASRMACPGGRFIFDIPDPDHVASLFSKEVTLKGSVEGDGCGQVFWEWTRYLDPDGESLVSRETIFRKENNRLKDKTVHIFRFRLYTPEIAANLLDGMYRPGMRAFVEDTTGRYRGLLKKRFILCFQKNA